MSIALTQETPRKPVILVVDDIPDNLTALVDILDINYQVRAATSGQQAIEMARKAPSPDLILLDIMMPDLDGYGVIGFLHNQPETRNIPVIFITAKTGTVEEEFGLNCGAVDYITKPIRPGIVRARVRTQLELKKARDELQMQNPLLTSELKRRQEEIQTAQYMTLDSLTELATIRDPESGEHLLRTQRYIQILARWLQTNKHYCDELSDQAIEMMVKSAPLHDIGKVGIPDRILLKTGKLSPAEWDIMKLHPIRGDEALTMTELRSSTSIPYLNYAREIARHHHEKWNGTGYPDGLKGDEIPLSARLMTIADVFDTLISDSVYKTAWDLGYAKECIMGLSGIDFDPLLVKVFEAEFDHILAIAEKYPEPGYPT